MIDLFDKLGQQLNDMIGSHENNNVAWAISNLPGYAEGGEVSDDNSLLGVLKATGKAAKDTFNNRDNILGNYTNSPTYQAQHYAQFGKFFTGAEQGNRYTDRYKQPEQSKPQPSASPTEFYAKWYNRLREFAQASEVANMGDVKTKSV